jgi:ferrous iron transport protein A
MDESIISLDKLKPGEKGIIQGYNVAGAQQEYLMELGLMIGTGVRLIKFAPLRDPIEIRVRSYHLSIRRSEANSILVKKVIE